jgi:hypothetical protein
MSMQWQASSKAAHPDDNRCINRRSLLHHPGPRCSAERGRVRGHRFHFVEAGACQISHAPVQAHMRCNGWIGGQRREVLFDQGTTRGPASWYSTPEQGT